MTLAAHAPVGAPSHLGALATTTSPGRSPATAARTPRSRSSKKRFGVPTDPSSARDRARAAALLVAALPGQPLHLPGRRARPARGRGPPARAASQDPMHFRSGGVDPGRDGCRVPLPWSRRPGAVRLQSRSVDRQPWLPQPADVGAAHGRGAGARTRTRCSYLYREALAPAPRAARARRRPLEWMGRRGPGASDVLAFRRGDDFVCVANIGDEPDRAARRRRAPPRQRRPLDAGGRLPGDSTAWLAPASATDHSHLGAAAERPTRHHPHTRKDKTMKSPARVLLAGVAVVRDGRRARRLQRGRRAATAARPNSASRRSRPARTPRPTRRSPRRRRSSRTRTPTSTSSASSTSGPARPSPCSSPAAACPTSSRSRSPTPRRCSRTDSSWTSPTEIEELGYTDSFNPIILDGVTGRRRQHLRLPAPGVRRAVCTTTARCSRRPGSTPTPRPRRGTRSARYAKTDRRRDRQGRLRADGAEQHRRLAADRADRRARRPHADRQRRRHGQVDDRQRGHEGDAAVPARPALGGQLHRLQLPASTGARSTRSSRPATSACTPPAPTSTRPSSRDFSLDPAVYGLTVIPIDGADARRARRR